MISKTTVARARLARLPVTIRDSLLSAPVLPPGAITTVARFFDEIAKRGDDLLAPSRGAFEHACPNESALGLLLRVLTTHVPEVCLSAGRELRKDYYRKRPGGTKDPSRLKPHRAKDRTQPRGWPVDWLKMLPALEGAPITPSTVQRYIASINRCAAVIETLSVPPRLGWLFAWELSTALREGNDNRSPVNARTIANYLGALVALGRYGGLGKNALAGMRSVQHFFVRQGRRLPKQKEYRLNQIYDAGGYDEILRTVVAKLEVADQLPDWSAAAAEARATAAVLAVCVNIPARTGDVSDWRLGEELIRTVWGTWELRWRQEKTGGWVTMGELWPEVAKVIDEHILGGRPPRLCHVRYAELEGNNWLSFDEKGYASRWPSERVADTIGVPLHDLRTLCADYLRLHDPARAPGIVGTLLGHRTDAAGRHYTALCVETAAQRDWQEIRQAHIEGGRNSARRSEARDLR